jgi:hypothetical protein
MPHQLFLPNPADGQFIGMGEVKGYSFYLDCHAISTVMDYSIVAAHEMMATGLLIKYEESNLAATATMGVTVWILTSSTRFSKSSA